MAEESMKWTVPIAGKERVMWVEIASHEGVKRWPREEGYLLWGEPVLI